MFRSLYVSREVILFILVANRLLGGVGGLGCLCLRKLIAYSSLGHSAWTLACLRHSDFVWLEYYLVYCFIFFCFRYIAFIREFYYSRDMGSFSSVSTGFSVVIVCLRGLPPFRVFIIKVCVLLSLATTSGNVFAFFLLRTSLLSLRYYLRLRINSYIFFTRRKVIRKLWIRSLPFYIFLIVNFFSAYVIFI